MKVSEALEKVLSSYERYYSINREPQTPFSAYAEFRSHNEKFVLVKSAKIADIDSNEFVYFTTPESLDSDSLVEFANAAWSDGIAKVVPYNGHRNSDVTLVVITNSFKENSTGEIKKLVKKTKFYKSYKWSLWGWSNFRLAVFELNSGCIATNWQGRDLKYIFIKNFLGGKK